MRDPLSPRNPQVARVRALGRDRGARSEARRFLVEGVKLVIDVLCSDLVVLDVYAEAGWAPPSALIDALEPDHVEITWLTPRAIERIASTTSPQPVVAEVQLPDVSWESIRPDSSLLIAVDLNDPGNLGTIVRSAVSAGFDAVVCLGDTTDPFAPKCIRASAGALFSVPVVVDRDGGSGLQRVGSLGIRRFGTRMQDAEPCDEADLVDPLALVLGSEAHGLGAEYDEFVDGWLAVPMPGRTESLNVAMAATILTYEVARQRRARLG